MPGHKYRKKIDNGNNQQNKSKKGKEKQKLSLKPLKIFFFLAIVLLIAAGLGTASIAYSLIRETPSFENLEFVQPAVTSYVFDRHGNELTSLYEEQNRIEIDLEMIPDLTQKAFIAIEDERFYEHIGFDTRGILRAAWATLRQQTLEGPGGSTITQQLARNTFLSPEKTIERKVREILLAVQIEQQYSKEEILEKYLNQIYFAHGAYGLEAAAQTYFNKNTSELTLAESALLAGILPSPNLYSPYKNPDLAKERQIIVLNKMEELELISTSETERAKNEELDFIEPPTREYDFPHFVDYLLHNELIKILTSIGFYNSREEAYNAVYTDGLKIYSTLEPAAQMHVENVLNDTENYSETLRVDMEQLKKMRETTSLSSYPDEVIDENGIPQPQSAAVVANPGTGEIIALVGGREYTKDNQDLRFLSRRQPGSAIKPVVAYAPAIEENLIAPGSIIDDSPYARGSWAPENFDRRFRGLTTVRESIVWSYNVPAVRTLMELTPEIGLSHAKNLGLTTIHENDYNLASALGGFTYGVTALDMAQAFGVFANQGVKINYHTITKIEDRNGHVIYERKGEPEAVLSPQTSYLITDMLKDVARRGTASRLNIGRPVAAKTGTTSDNRDAYLVAYTPNLVVSFWMGHDIPKLGRIAGGSSSTITFVNQIMQGVLENEEDFPVRDFERPPGISSPISICSKSGLRPGENCPQEHITSDIFPVDLIPQENCEMHVTVDVCSSSGLLPGEFCPEESIETKTFIDRPEYIVTDHRWSGGAGRGPADAALMTPENVCDVHTYRPEQLTGFSFYLERQPLQAHLSWERVQDPGNFKEILLLRREDFQEEFTTLARLNPEETFYLDEGINSDRTYIYRLIAISEVGVQSAPSELLLQTPAVDDSDREEEPPDNAQDPGEEEEENEGENEEDENNTDNNRGTNLDNSRRRNPSD